MVAGRGNDAGPTDNKWRGDSAFLGEMFESAERSVGGVGPGRAIALIHILGAGHELGIVADMNWPAIAGFAGNVVPVGPHIFLAAAVVGEEDHDRIAIDLAFASGHRQSFRRRDRATRPWPHRPPFAGPATRDRWLCPTARRRWRRH